MKLKLVKGTRDLYGENVDRFQYLEDTARAVFTRFGYQEIRTPIFESTELFTHSVGEDTDIVGKEMYLLEDRRGRSLALRPEGTASVVRTVITDNLMQQNTHLKFYYFGPMFRYEQPQKGRFRQFYQIGAECFGVATPDADLELLLMLQRLFHEVQLNNVSFQLNTIGCQKNECRPAFKGQLLKYLQGYRADLCEDCNRRMETNPLRVLDCKKEKCITVTEDAPKIYDEVCQDCSDHFSELTEMLQHHSVAYRLNSRLVRGLDYYSRTVFEVYSENLGAQNAAGGGGRYDGLFEILGAPQVPSLGFALGLDRLAMLISPQKKNPYSLFVIGHDRLAVSKLVAQCRDAGFICYYDPLQSSMKSQFRQANKKETGHVLIIGETELNANVVAVKNMQDGSQNELPLIQVISFLKDWNSSK